MASALAHVGWESCLIAPHRDRLLETYARRNQVQLERLSTLRCWAGWDWGDTRRNSRAMD
jgi:hypothetical protein